MPPEILYLSLLSLAAFAIFFCFGRVFTKSSKWKFVDLVYYPLGAVGIIVAYSQSSHEREYVALLQSQSAASNLIKKVDGEEPAPAHNYDFTVMSIDETFLREIAEVTDSKLTLAAEGNRFFSLQTELATTTREFLESIPRVSASQDPIEIMRSKLNLLQCTRKYVERIDDIIDSPLSAEFLRAFRESENEDDNGDTDINKIVYRTVSFYSQMQFMIQKSTVPALVNPDKQLNDEFSILYGIMRAIGKVALVPDEYIDEKLAWQKRHLAAVSAFEEAENARNNFDDDKGKLALSSIFRSRYWPYIIVFALALKFGKGVASVGETKKPKEERNDEDKTAVGSTPIHSAQSIA